MARPLPSLPMQTLSWLPIPAATFIVLIAILSVFSLVSFLCASHKTTKLQRQKEETTAGRSSNKKVLYNINSNISSKALLMVKMISWRKVQAEEEEEEEEEEDCDDDEAVWKKTIIMGERCRPLEFSGRIAYDSEGNLLPDSPQHNCTSKLVSCGKS